MGGFMHGGQRGTGHPTKARRSVVGRCGVKGLLCVMAGLLTALALVPAAFAAAPTYNMTGTWTTGYRSGATNEAPNGTWNITTMNMTSGAFSGTAEIDKTQFVLRGTESGAEVQQELTEGSYTAHDVYSLSVLSSGHVGTDNGTFEGSGEFWSEQVSTSVEEPGKKAKEEEAAKKAKEEAEKASALRGSATEVSCDYEFATSTDTCTAQVADAGAAPEVVPTGTVTFTNTGAGGFPYGTTCTIAASASAPGVPFCSVIFLGGGSGLPMITASYGGDSRHSPSDGSTSFAQFAPPEEMGEEFAFGGPEQFPETVTVETEVPAEGTTVDGTVNQQTGEETDPPDPNSPIGIALDSIPKVNAATLDGTGATDLTALAALVKEFPYSTDLNTAAKTIEAKGEALLDYARQLEASGDPARIAQAKSLYDQMVSLNTSYELIVRVIANDQAGVTSATKPVATKSSIGPLATVARRHRRPRARFTLFGSVLEHDVHSGKLALTVHLNKGLMRRLARTHSKLTVRLWIEMILPSKVVPGGIPVVSVKTVTLRRSNGHRPTAKGHRPGKKH
jgi:hypothetical protein